MATWIFLRGLTRESRHWGSFVGQFEQAFPHDLVVPLDMMGNGRLNQQNSPRRVAEMVADCRAQLVQRQLAPPYQVLAMSLGAMVSVAWAQACPPEVAAQVLINTSMRPFNPFYQRLKPANYATLLRLVWPGATPEDIERAILRLTSQRGHTSVLPAWVALRRANPVSRHNALNQLLAAARFSAPVATAVTPTLLLASAGDQLVSVKCSQALAAAWQCPLQMHPWAGHDLPLDDPPWVIARVQAWLSHKRNLDDSK